MTLKCGVHHTDLLSANTRAPPLVQRTYSYRWYRNGAAISGATAKSYILRSADRGTAIKVKVTGRKSGYTTASRVSASTTAVR